VNLDLGVQMKYKIGTLIVVATLSISGSFVAVANPVTTTTNPAGMAVDPSTQAFYSLGVCSKAQQLDCIQSVEVKGPTGEYVEAILAAPQVWTIEQELNGNTRYNGAPLWTAAPLIDEPFPLAGEMYTPSWVWDDLSNRGIFSIWASEVPRGFSVKVAVRTSWVKAQNLQFISDEASYTKESISGGNLWTFSGTHSKVSVYTEDWKIRQTMQDPMDWSAQADLDDHQIGFTIHHAGPTADLSWWDPKCSDTGFTAQAFNSNAAGSPDWNYEEGYLEFNIFAPHLDASGALNSGFFRLWVNEEFASCQWPGNTLVGAESLEALILNEDGSIQRDAELTVTNENGMIYLDAGNFHYSVPTFIIRPSAGTSAPATSLPSQETPSLAKTGSHSSWWIVWGSMGMIAVGAIFVALGGKLQRRTR
jgi:hypothetical protein